MGVQTIQAEAESPRRDAGWALLPAESPLPMPEQTLHQGALKVRRHRTSPRLIGLRRLYIFGGTLGMTAVATRMMWRVLSANGISVLEACLLVLFVGLFAWIALSFASALVSFLTAVFDRGYRLGIDPDKPLLGRAQPYRIVDADVQRRSAPPVGRPAGDL